MNASSPDSGELLPLLLFSGVLPQEAAGLAASLLVLFAAIYVLFQPKHSPLDFKNAYDEPIKVLDGDTRVTRFTHGDEISTRGRDLAGDNPYLVRNNRHRDLVIVTPDQLREFAANDLKDHTKQHGGGLGDYAWRMLGSCVGQQSGEKWKLMRSHFDPQFSAQQARQAEPVFQTCIKEWLDSLPPTPPTSSFIRDALGSCHGVAFKLLALMSYGEVLNDEMFTKLNSLTKLHKQMMGTLLFNTKTMSRIYNMLPTVHRQQLKEFERSWTQFNLEAVTHARREGLHCPVERIYAGVERGDMTLQEFQSRLRAEILNEKQQASYNAVQYAGKQDTLLHYVTLESLRLNAALHFSPAACTAEDKIIGGYRIPSGTPCIVDVRRINTNRTAWGEDAESFRPERFAGLPASAYRFSMIRWGVASSKCMGKNMADLVLKLTVIAVLERYELRPAVLKGEGDQHLAITTSKSKKAVEFRAIGA